MKIRLINKDYSVDAELISSNPLLIQTGCKIFASHIKFIKSGYHKRLPQTINSQALMQNALFAADGLTEGLEGAYSWLITVVGPAVIVLGIVASGYFIVVGNRDGTTKAIMSVIGGIIITSATSIVDLITGWAG